MDSVFFKDRAEAGRELAHKLIKYKDEDPVVLALPRGGVVLGSEISRALNCPLDLIITRKIGHPTNPEYAIAAVSVSGEMVANEAEISLIDQNWFEKEKALQIEEAKRRQKVYLGDKKPIDLASKTAIIVDDGVATGLTMMAAIKEVKSKNPKKITLAVPVIPFEIYEALLKLADEVVAVAIPDDFLGSVGAYYAEFPQVSDEKVIRLMK